MSLEKKLTRSAAEAAAETLRLEATSIDVLTVYEVKVAYRDLLKKIHPDTATGIAVIRAGDRIFAARKAKELLREWIDMRPDPACVCGGTGYIRGSGFSSRECPRCMRGMGR